MKNFLLIVEGEKTEKDIFKEIFERYGCNVILEDKVNLPDGTSNSTDFSRCDFAYEKNNIVVIQGPRNRISDLLRLFKKEHISLDKWLLKSYGIFAGVFWIYDVDHTTKEELDEMFNNFQDESTRGLLLVSSPCIEVVADINRTNELNCGHLYEYKKEMNLKLEKICGKHTKQYIIDNFERLILYYLEKNFKESNNPNIMEHPSFIVKKINELNERGDPTIVLYRYFTTVIYCSIAFIFGLTKEIDNYEIVKNFFLTKTIK